MRKTLRFTSIVLLTGFCPILLQSNICSGNSSDKPKASLILRSINPAPGSSVSRDTVLDATLEYAIDSTKVGVDVYYIHPMFETAEGGTFNAIDLLKDGARVLKPSGVIEFKYPILREFDDPRLVKPIKLHYYLMKRAAHHVVIPIAQTDAVAYVPLQ